MDSQVKRIILPETSHNDILQTSTDRKKIEKKEKEKRKVTHRKQGDFQEGELTNDKQLEYITNMYLQQTNNIEADERIQHIQRVIESQINQDTRIPSTRYQKEFV